MKILKTLAMLTIFMFLLSATSCVIVPRQHDNGKHKGWFKNSNNPNHYKRAKHYKVNVNKREKNQKNMGVGFRKFKPLIY